jgi:hypothetical protein
MLGFASKCTRARGWLLTQLLVRLLERQVLLHHQVLLLHDDTHRATE